MRLFTSAVVSSLIVLSSSMAAEARSGNRGGSIETVRSYIKRDGTVVAAHYRTAPDGRLDNNLSYGGKSPLRGDIPKTVTAIPQTTGAIPQTVIAGVASEKRPVLLETAAALTEPTISRHHVSCPNEKSVGGTDPYNTFCLIN